MERKEGTGAAHAFVILHPLELDRSYDDLNVLLVRTAHTGKPFYNERRVSIVWTVHPMCLSDRGFAESIITAGGLSGWKLDSSLTGTQASPWFLPSHPPKSTLNGRALSSVPGTPQGFALESRCFAFSLIVLVGDERHE